MWISGISWHYKDWNTHVAQQCCTNIFYHYYDKLNIQQFVIHNLSVVTVIQPDTFPRRKLKTVESNLIFSEQPWLFFCSRTTNCLKWTLEARQLVNGDAVSVMSVLVSDLFLLHCSNLHDRRRIYLYPSLLFLFCLNKVRLLHAGSKVAVVLTEKLGEGIGVRPSCFVLMVTLFTTD